MALRGTELGHSVLRETLLVECQSEEDALLLRSRLGDINETRLMPVIERVLTETDPTDRHISIEHLEVDLGAIGLDDLEDTAPGRLYTELKAALERAIASPFSSASRSPQAARVEILETFLLRGTLKSFAPQAEGFTLDAWLEQMALHDPDQLADVIRRTGANDYVLERIVQQATARVLKRLISVLDPEHAALIVSYLLDLHEIHREEPLAAADESAFDRLLWFLALSYLVREAGSQFNRKAFVESLIRGFAVRHGMRYEDTLALLGMGLDRVLLRHGLPSSLPAVIAELISDSDPSHRSPGLAGWSVITGSALPDQVVHSVAQPRNARDSAVRRPEELARQVRLHAADTAWLERLVAALDEKTLVRLIELLEPADAALIIEFLFDVRDVHRESPVLSDNQSRFEVLLWVVALALIVEDHGSEFNRRTFLRSLLLRVAQDAGLEFARVLATFQAGLERAARKQPLRSSLPAIFASLLEDIARDDPDFDALLAAITPGPAEGSGEHLRVVTAAVAGMDDASVRRLLSRVLPAADSPGPLAEALRLRSSTADMRPFYARLISASLRGDPLDFEEPDPLLTKPEEWNVRELKAAITARLLATRVLAPGDYTASSLIGILFRRDPREARLFLRSLAAQARLRESLVGSHGSGEFESVLDLLAGANAPPIRALLRGFAELNASDRPSLDQIRSVLLSECLREDPARDADPAFFRRVLAAMFPTPLPERIRAALFVSCPQEASVLRAALAAPDSQDSQPKERADFVEEQTVNRESLQIILRDQRARAQLVRGISRTRFQRILQLLDPAQAGTFDIATRILASAWVRALPRSRLDMVEEEVRKIFLEGIAGGFPSLERLTEAVLRRFLDSAPEATQAIAVFRRESESLAGQTGLPSLRSALSSVIPPRPVQIIAPARRAFMPPSGAEPEEPIYVENAGIVLASPFLPHLFSSLDFLEDGDKGRKRWRSDQIASRAVHLIQYLADERVSAPEPALVLNKVLCGLHPAWPVEKEIRISEQEASLCEKLIRALISNWQIVSSSSPAAIRETFFQRRGKLEYADGKWRLEVQRKTLDVLVDQAPWSYSFVFHDWMQEPLHVTW